MTYELGILLALTGAAAVQDTDNPPRPASRYEVVIHAQYAAHAPPQPLQPEEAQRIYEGYLKSIGQATGDKSTNGADDDHTQPH